MRYIQFIGITIVLFLNACSGSANQGQTATTTTPEPVASGESIYKKTCIACHQATGEGIAGAFPPLAKSDYLADHEYAIKQVLKGSSGELVVNGKTYNNVMPPQALTDEEIAAVLTYVYCNFGNKACTITPAEVKTIRATLL